MTVEDDDDDEWATFATAAIYTGVMVAWGCAVWGTGYYYPPYYGGFYGGYPMYYGPYPTYGYGASYNPWTGAYSRGAVAYGPYGGAGVGARYNPRTGTYARGAAAYGPYGSRAAGQAYNPRTGAYGQTRQGSNVYGSWGTTGPARRPVGAHLAGRTADRRPRRGRPSDERRRRRRHPARAGRGPRRRADGSGDVYAGRDGNVYRNQGGSWQKYDNGNWGAVGPPVPDHPLRRSGHGGDRDARRGRPAKQRRHHGQAQPRLLLPLGGHPAHPRLRELQQRAAGAELLPVIGRRGAPRRWRRVAALTSFWWRTPGFSRSTERGRSRPRRTRKS